ncbi:CatA-like O-acetyltransferase [Lewinella sp. LCG006]|uniref:CatA-like O-acetyltransferase n=1 Tax=Lewinella sp. LCG006 TaxID=3231911 RepID=UPI00345F735E
MKIITFSNPHRQKHFDFFRKMDQPHFSLVANVDITRFLAYIKERELPFTPYIVYLLSKAANDIPAFRWRIRGEQVVEHSTVQPSFTVPTEVSEVFSFCTVDYDQKASVFIERAMATIERMKTAPDFEDEPGRDDFLFMSAIPWVSFTGLTHAMHYSPADSVPRISWGKYFKQEHKVLMPLAVQAHHATVDGRDMGHYFQQVEALFLQGETLFEV